MSAPAFQPPESMARIDRALQPDIILPVQFADLMRAQHLGPFEKLLAAVLQDALRHVIKERRYVVSNTRRPRRDTTYRQNDLNWIFGEPEPFTISFTMCCDAVGIDAGALRKRVAQTLG